jgi:hypothetical protein
MIGPRLTGPSGVRIAEGPLQLITAVGAHRTTYRVLVGGDSLEDLGVNRGIMFKVYLKRSRIGMPGLL